MDADSRHTPAATRHSLPSGVPTATVTPLRRAVDARGTVVEPLGAAEFAAQRNAHLVLTARGAVRGNHVHARGHEVAVVLGPALVRLREDGGVRDVEVPVGEAWRFDLPPGVGHAFRATGDAPMVLIAFNSVPHDPADPDVAPDPLLAP